MYDKGMHGMFGMYDFAAAGSGRDRVGRDRRFPTHGRTVTQSADTCDTFHATRISPMTHVTMCSPIYRNFLLES